MLTCLACRGPYSGREHGSGAECWVAHSTEAFARQRIADSQPLQRDGMYTPHTSDQKAVIAEGACSCWIQRPIGISTTMLYR